MLNIGLDEIKIFILYLNNMLEISTKSMRWSLDFIIVHIILWFFRYFRRNTDRAKEISNTVYRRWWEPYQFVT